MAVLLPAAGAAALACPPTGSARPATIPAAWKNCTAVNQRYPHGVGKAGAHDKTSDTPVSDFKHSSKLYALAMKYNRGLDRDHDGIACEKE